MKKKDGLDDRHDYRDEERGELKDDRYDDLPADEGWGSDDNTGDEHAENEERRAYRGKKHDDDSYDESYEEDDNERDLFYTLTDGQYGDYDDWRRNGGDIDSLMERLGY